MESFFSLFSNFLFIKTYGFESFNLIFGPFTESQQESTSISLFLTIYIYIIMVLTLFEK